MKKISRRLSHVIDKELTNHILPIKTENGILVGDVEIVSDNNLKHVQRNGILLYKNIYLNIAATKIANLIAVNRHLIGVKEIYRQDQEYGRYFVDSQQLRSFYERSVQQQDYEAANIYWARYTERKDRATAAKNRLEALVKRFE